MRLAFLIRKRLNDFKKYAKKSHVPVFFVLFDYFKAIIVYGFTIQDYLEIADGIKLSRYEKKRFLTHKRAKKIMVKVNSVIDAYKLENKVEALKLFSKYVRRDWCYPKEMTLEQYENFVYRIREQGKALIVKPLGGMCGEGIFKKSYLNVKDDEIEKDYNHFVENDYLVEECLIVHPDLNLNNKSLNTFRVFTFLDKNGVIQVVKAKFRAGVGESIVDATLGCIHYPVNIEYGIIEGPGVNLDDMKIELHYTHPGCEKILVGLKIPFWENVLEMVVSAAKNIPEIRLIGWDVAITENGPEIIEANHNPYHGTFEELGNERLWYPKLKSMI